MPYSEAQLVCFDESRCYTILKYILMTYNFFFVLFSYVLLGLGVYSEMMREEYAEIDFDHVFITPSVFLFAVGTLASVFAMIGFVAALRDNICLLKTFTTCVFLCILLEASAATCALIFKDPAKNFVNKFILKGMVTYYDDQDLKNFIDYVQEEFQCCGGRLYKDWVVNPYHNCTAPGPAACGVPFSCCLPDIDDSVVINSMCGYDTIAMRVPEVISIIHTTGCIDAVIDFFWLNLDIVAGILLGFFVPQVIGVVCGVSYIRIIQGYKDASPSSPFSLEEQSGFIEKTTDNETDDHVTCCEIFSCKSASDTV